MFLMSELAIIIPVYNNAQSLRRLNNNIINSLKKIKLTKYTLVYVDDASQDNSLKILNNLKRKNNKNIIVLNNKINIGQSGSILTGVNYQKSKFYFVMSADGQDEPFLIEKFYKNIKANKMDIMLFCKKNLNGTLIRKIFAYTHYKILNIATFGKYPKYGSDVFGFTYLAKQKIFDFLDKKDVIQAELIQSDLPKKYIYFKKKDRVYGQSNQKFSSLLYMHLRTLFSLDSFGIKLVWISTVLSVIGFGMYSLYILISFIVLEDKIYTGWRSLILINLLCFALIFIHMGHQSLIIKKILNRLNNNIK
tara:strand:+ start:3018 stop:3935 length:918 start_codon:yes stop_codon:yes gene_type:complete